MFDVETSVGQWRVVGDSRPAERQGVGYDLAQLADPDPDRRHRPTGGVPLRDVRY
jgi:hypothetical protein